MRRSVRILLIVLGVLVVLPVLAGVVFMAAFDPMSVVPRITEAVKARTGRDLRIGGLRLYWSLMPWPAPEIVATDVSLSNVPGGSEPDMMRIGRIEARVELVPLLSRRVMIGSLRLTGPRLLLETDASGRGNWVFARGTEQAGHAVAAQAADDARTDTKRLAVDLRLVRLEGGSVRLRDNKIRQTLDLALPTVSLDATQAGTSVAAQAVLSGQPLVPTPLPITLQGTTGPLAALTMADGGPSWPVHVTLSVAGATAVIDGAFAAPARLGGADLGLTMTFPDVAAFVPGLPLRDVAATARFSETAEITGLSLRAGESDLGTLLPGLRLHRLQVAAPAPGQPMRVELDAALADAPINAAATVLPRPDRQGAALRGLTLETPAGGLAGDIAVAWQPGPAVRGSLVSQRLDLDALRGLLNGLRRPEPAPVSAPAGPAPPRVRAVPDMTLPFAALRGGNLDLSLTVAALRMGGADWRDLSTKVLLQGGRLRIDPLRVTAPGGPVAAVLTADAAAVPPAATLALHAPNIALAPLAALFSQADAASGEMQFEATLTGAGASLHPFLATLEGAAALTVVDAEIVNHLVAPLLESLLSRARLPLGSPADPAVRAKLRCVALRTEIHAGRAEVKTLFIELTHGRLSGEGSVNFADETLALRLRPTVRVGGARVAVPVRVNGSFLRPDAKMDALHPGRVGVVIGGATPVGEDCDPALLAARGGRPGPLPSAPSPAGAAARPGDILRNLFNRR